MHASSRERQQKAQRSFAFEVREQSLLDAIAAAEARVEAADDWHSRERAVRSLCSLRRQLSELRG
jgi:hypothetical protein